jgi:hypothetical protein
MSLRRRKIMTTVYLDKKQVDALNAIRIQGDGHPDLVVAQGALNYGVVSVLYGYGDGTFAPRAA